MVAFSLKKQERITKRSEFLTIYQQGIRYNTQNFSIIIFPGNKEAIRRLGITVSKKVGGAVIRNRVKRLLREFFRLHKEHLPEASDILFIAKPGSSYLKYSALFKELVDFFKRI
ncbi:MAG: ribonuclease P protein component [Thermodesulfobacteriota bacterium]|jgi:ribonuclease P protein component|nr:MAG: ribonuclease P protein component [Thermodesulfobacteriota bacterium]